MEEPFSQLVSDVADALVEIDNSRVPHRQFLPGVGPYGEPQLLKLVAEHLNTLAMYRGKVATKRTPDLLIKGDWAVECKIARPFGDNGQPAENWSVNLLHPYQGNVSLLGDCMKLAGLDGLEKKAVLVIGYEHTPAKITLAPLLESFEVIAKHVLKIKLGPRTATTRSNLVHPVHQQLLVCGWEVMCN